ncbi:tetratricopeptide repeat protein [Pseudenhygromyxa sp. WMMC2535]|uniref:tetratricopeptide repeat protein n=1 Tax=Pseudenhygromyxa sp. WMMC2535 TaxID=2712867 RepID=UPI001556932B|nr:tetratricopeptide repeat protein [Pseudenhygromyxa sp. WMMC2535]NVB36837.1 tetratricopeptide repeat protein [Pseudenhygromyxa sp. WMMC2535]
MSSSAVVHRSLVKTTLTAALGICLGAGLAGCATTGGAGAGEGPEGANPSAARSPQPAQTEAAGEQGDPAAWLAAAEQALDGDRPARAAALFARYLGEDARAEGARQAYLGLARAHEQLGDFEAAIRAYEGFLANFPEDPQAVEVLSRRGACEAEISSWERSAASFAEVLTRGGEALLPSERVEALARQGYALFELERFDAAEAVLAQADAIYKEATESGEERFQDTYFVAMARFYQAGILHVRFRQSPIRLPEAQMAKDFEAKLALLERAHEAYNEVIRARHVFWVSAAGYQLGSLFEEFYDSVMYAPMPDWLDESQRRIYYAELEEQLRPVVEKAVWVFEKNLETARKLGYDNDFIARSEERLASLQSIMLGRDERQGPVPRLAPQRGGGAARGTGEQLAISGEDLPAIERELFVPLPTTL